MRKLILSFFLILSMNVANSQTVVTFYTSMGEFEVLLYDTLMPITAGNFKTLVQDEFYDGVIFHRVIQNFVIQGGDPTGTGSGGPGYTIPDEFDSTLSNIQKTLSMANSGPNSGGSQFFINMKANTFLDFDKAPLTSAHPVFGEVISGWLNVAVISTTPVDANDRPVTDVVMDSIRVNGPPLSVDNFDYNSQINVYPNPSDGNAVIHFNSPQNELVTFNVINQSGQTISVVNRNVTMGFNQIMVEEICPNDLAAGIYFLSIQIGDQIVQKKLVIQ